MYGTGASDVINLNLNISSNFYFLFVINLLFIISDEIASIYDNIKIVIFN